MKNLIGDDLSQDRADEILDKIFKYGLLSLTKHEKEFLDVFSLGEEDVIKSKLRILDLDTFFEDDYFKFELDDIKYKKDAIQYIGTLYVPDLEKSL